VQEEDPKEVEERILQSERNQKYTELLDDLKSRINDFLFGVLPDETTLRDYDEMGCKVLDLICKEWTLRGYEIQG